MAGYVKLSRLIWTDHDFTAVPAMAQRLYLFLISQPDITHVGIVPLMPGRWERLAPDTTPEELLDALKVLEAHGFVVTDHTTHEVWVRSYIVYDEAFKLTNGKKSLVNAYYKVYSDHIKSLVAVILARVGVTLDSTLESTVDLSQQPAASFHEPDTSSHDSESTVLGNPLSFLSDAQRETAAAAFERYVAWRRRSPDTNKPASIERIVRSKANEEQYPRIAKYLTENPDATVAEVCRFAMDMPAHATRESA
jgi:hypothetical protein